MTGSHSDQDLAAAYEELDDFAPDPWSTPASPERGDGPGGDVSAPTEMRLTGTILDLSVSDGARIALAEWAVTKYEWTLERASFGVLNAWGIDWSNPEHQARRRAILERARLMDRRERGG
ncbi:MAG: hypothetical protein AAGA90_24125 [Actinomycetota bacterium]